MSDPKPQLYDQGYGDTSPEWTEQFGAALAEQKARLATLMPFLDPNLRRERQAEAEAAAEAERQAAWPDARQALRQAHAELATALAELRRRQEAATRGATVLDRARDVLRSAQLAHGQVTESATTLLRQAIERGEDLPATGEGEECELLDAVDDARAAVAIAEGASRQLETAAGDAGVVVERARGAVRTAATAVMVSHAVELADQLGALDAQALALRAKLGALAMTWVERPDLGRSAAIPLPASVARALNPPPAAALRPGLAGWQERYEALCADPEAELPG